MESIEWCLPYQAAVIMKWAYNNLDWEQGRYQSHTSWNTCFSCMTWAEQKRERLMERERQSVCGGYKADRYRPEKRWQFHYLWEERSRFDPAQKWHFPLPPHRQFISSTERQFFTPQSTCWHQPLTPGNYSSETSRSAVPRQQSIVEKEPNQIWFFRVNVLIKDIQTDSLQWFESKVQDGPVRAAVICIYIHKK